MPKQTDTPKKSSSGEPWRPRVDSQPVLHSYANVNQEPDPLTESPNITDPSEDTAPLQGSLDRSDDDSLTDDYVAEDDGRDADEDHTGEDTD